MFVGFTKTLKKMSGFRIGFGIRINKKNWWYWLLVMCFVGMFYLMWYTIIAVGWCLYYLCYALYKIYYYLFKGIALGVKKLFDVAARKQETPAGIDPPVVVEPSAPVSVPALGNEEAAGQYVLAALEAGGVDLSTLSFDRTADYLKIVADPVNNLCFCRLKMSGQSPYMELTISAKDAKALADDPRFGGIELAKRRFTRIPIASAEDVPQYADVIRLAYTWGTTTA